VQIEARTYHVTHGCPPRHYAVTFTHGGDRRASVARGGVSREYSFTGHGYKPGSKAHIEHLISLFDAAIAEPAVERINDELRAAGEKRPAARSIPAAARIRPPPVDRQLPASDRA
jgi:hypothetical protein